MQEVNNCFSHVLGTVLFLLEAAGHKDHINNEGTRFCFQPEENIERELKKLELLFLPELNEKLEAVTRSKNDAWSSVLERGFGNIHNK